MKRILALIFFMASIAQAFAQSVSVEAKIDSVAILIGEQAHLTVSVTARQGAHVVYPHFKRTQQIVPGVEVLHEENGDTSEVDGLLKISKTFTLTSFDEHLYALPSMKVKVDGKTYGSNPLALKVITCDVDTLHPEKFFPPKDVQDNPFQWSEWSGMFWLSLLAVVLGVSFFYLAVRLKQNKPIITRIHIVKRIPPHQKALNEMDRLKHEQFSSDDDQKNYYTQLTDALRQYIKERFGFNAMEMTSSEILHNLQSLGDDKMMEELRELFATADLVKFAKYSTLLNEKDMNLINAINFIDQTKRDDMPTEERIVPQLSENDIKTRNNRILIKTLMWVAAVVAAGIVAYIVHGVFLLLQ